MEFNKHAFFIPIAIDHLVVHHESANHKFAGQLADFSLLPHRKPGEDCTPPRIKPNISEDLVSKPFEPTNDPLHSGVHLHWTLPKEFRRAIIIDDPENPEQSGIRYRPVPNRWLIERKIYDPKTNELAKIDDVEVKPKKWILESDALLTKKENGSVAFPLDPDKYPSNGGPAYRYLGKVYSFKDWKELKDIQDYKEKKNNLDHYDDEISFKDWKSQMNQLNNKEAYKAWREAMENFYLDWKKQRGLDQNISYEIWKQFLKQLESLKNEIKNTEDYDFTTEPTLEEWKELVKKHSSIEGRGRGRGRKKRSDASIENIEGMMKAMDDFEDYLNQKKENNHYDDDISYDDWKNKKDQLNNEKAFEEWKNAMEAFYTDWAKDKNRTTGFEEWKKLVREGSEKTPYLDTLTAFGYGEPLYNAYYPESRNVFGFHDDLSYYKDKDEENIQSLTEITKGHQFEIRYRITGWYSKPWEDPMQIADFQLWRDVRHKAPKDELLDFNYPDNLKTFEKGKDNQYSFALLPQLKHQGSANHIEEFNWFVNFAFLEKQSEPRESRKNLVHEFNDSSLSEKLSAEENSNKAIFDLSIATNDSLKGTSILTGSIDKIIWGQGKKINPTGILSGSYYGIVTGNNLGLPKATVQVKDTNIGVQTDFDGRFSIVLNHPSPLILIIRHPEYTTKEIKLNSSSSFKLPNIILDKNLKIVLANSPGQALAALLADGEEKTDQDQEDIKKYSSHDKERMLDALQLGLFTEEKKLDFPARLDSALHEAGFSGTKGESRWNITTERTNTDEVGKNTSDPIPAIEDKWSDLLQSLNENQIASDQLKFEITALQEQLYADWYKFMVAEYDLSLDEITSEAHVNKIREFLADQVYKLKEKQDEQQSKEDSLNEIYSSLMRKIEAWNETNAFKRIKFKLQVTAGPRYWMPNEPVLLFQGGGVRPDPRYQPSNERAVVNWMEDFFKTDSEVADLSDLDIVNKLGEFINSTSELTALDVHPDSTTFAYQDGSHSGWNPIMMDWEVELFPFTKPGDKDFHQRDWPYDSIVANYDLLEGHPDLRLQDADELKNADFNDPHPYSQWVNDNINIQQQSGKRLQTLQGRTLLTANAHLPFVEQLKNQLEYAEEKNDVLIQKLNNLGVLSQSLAGFNQLLLMRKQILQLKVNDPLAQLNILKDFTEQLRDAIGNNNRTAPLPSNLFLPIREGAFQIRKIRLIDCWGRTKDFNFSQNRSDGRIIIADSMRPPRVVFPRKKHMAYLPPRIVQPCRLNFRWLSSEKKLVEAGSHTNDSPICGYFLPNFLDSSLHIYDASGKGLWILGKSGNKLELKPLPGTHEIPSPDDESINKYLRNFVNSIKENPPEFLGDFLWAARDSTNANLTENYAQFDGMALLVGRPLALVRAKMNLELKGIPAVNNSWNARETEYFGQEQHVSASMGFDKLRFAVRLGEKNRVGDGFFAYYIEKEGQGKIREIYSPYSNPEKAKVTPQESYWKTLAIKKKWSAVYNERLLIRDEEYASTYIALDAIESDIEDAEIKISELKLDIKDSSDNIEQKEVEISKISREIKRLEILQKSTNTKLINLEDELRRLESLVKEAEFEITEIKEKHGFLQSGPGIYRPHSDLLTLSLEEDEVHLGILLDPRNPVHLTTGILPVKKVDIPPELFADAINNIQIAFLTTPMISPVPLSKEEIEADLEKEEDKRGFSKGEIEQKFLLHYPKQKGYQWSWIQPESDGSWPEYDPDQIEIPPPGQFPVFRHQAIFEGWMKMNPEQEDKINEDKND